jgi:methionyl-tRNA synthetase
MTQVIILRYHATTDVHRTETNDSMQCVCIIATMHEQPEDKRAFILARLAEPLNDLSISRTTFKWGIPVPEGFEKDHVMYVWFDALSNYISSIHALDPR